MSRPLTSGMSAAVGADQVAPAFLCDLDFSSATVRVWSGKGNFVWSGVGTYTGVGDYGGISQVEESKKVSANGVELSLSGIPSIMISHALNDTYRGRSVKIWMALFNVTTSVMIADPVQVFAGRMDTLRIADNGSTSTILINCESRLIDLERPRERRYTDEDLQEAYPGDLGLHYVAGLQGVEIFWGRVSKK